MKDLAYSDTELAEQKERMDKCCTMPPGYEGPKYPWGLELSLEDSSLEKLGLSATDFKVGTEVPLMIMARVSRVSMSETADGGKHQNVGLIAAKMEVAKSDNLEQRVADKLYKEST